ncbi:MAG: GT-D fold domain-containing glycosyltransferase [bacterium]
MSDICIWKNRLQKFLDNPKALLPFLKKRLHYNRIADKQLPYYKDFKFFDYEHTIDDIITHNKSIVRFGDELFDMLQGIGLYYGNWRQKYSPDLAKRLREVISSRDPRILVCFNPEFILKTKEDFEREGIPEQYQFWTNSKIFLKDYYHKDVIYGSALCFTPRYNTRLDFQKLKYFFLKKHIIILTSGIERFRDVALGRTTELLEAPASDAWQKYDMIKESLLSLIGTKGVSKNEILVLVSMGSAAKVLVFDLTQLGYTAWDTGQFFDLAFREIKKIL